MKRKLKENQMDINKKDKEIEKMKKAPKLTRILELEAYIYNFKIYPLINY